jgi:hypothetical protein
VENRGTTRKRRLRRYLVNSVARWFPTLRPRLRNSNCRLCNDRHRSNGRGDAENRCTTRKRRLRRYLVKSVAVRGRTHDVYELWRTWWTVADHTSHGSLGRIQPTYHAWVRKLRVVTLLVVPHSVALVTKPILAVSCAIALPVNHHLTTRPTTPVNDSGSRGRNCRQTHTTRPCRLCSGNDRFLRWCRHSGHDRGSDGSCKRPRWLNATSLHLRPRNNRTGLNAGLRIGIGIGIG